MSSSGSLFFFQKKKKSLNLEPCSKVEETTDGTTHSGICFVFFFLLPGECGTEDVMTISGGVWVDTFAPGWSYAFG